MNYWWKVEGGEGQGIMEIDSKLCGLVKIDGKRCGHGKGVVVGGLWEEAWPYLHLEAQQWAASGLR